MEVDMIPCKSEKCKKKIGGQCKSCRFDFKEYERKRQIEITNWQNILIYIDENKHKTTEENIQYLIEKYTIKKYEQHK